MPRRKRTPRRHNFGKVSARLVGQFQDLPELIGNPAYDNSRELEQLLDALTAAERRTLGDREDNPADEAFPAKLAAWSAGYQLGLAVASQFLAGGGR